jgi:hypothetical protein
MLAVRRAVNIRKWRMDGALKICGGFLLMLSAALPLATCSHYEDPEGKHVNVKVGETQAEGVREVVESHYVLGDTDLLDVGDWPIVLFFFWPVATLAALHFKPRGVVAMTVRGLELILVGCTFYWFNWVAFLYGYGHLASGAYLTLVAASVYAMGALWSDVLLYRNQKSGTRA